MYILHLFLPEDNLTGLALFTSTQNFTKNDYFKKDMKIYFSPQKHVF
jgi:hypothetical protein